MHFFGCLFIFVGRTFSDNEDGNISWIEQNNFKDQDIPNLYSTAAYFTM